MTEINFPIHTILAMSLHLSWIGFGLDTKVSQNPSDKLLEGLKK
jgi:hypothetical protein